MFPYKDVNLLPEIKLLDNEEIIFSNYKISAFDEGYTTWNQNLRFITVLKLIRRSTF